MLRNDLVVKKMPMKTPCCGAKRGVSILDRAFCCHGHCRDTIIHYYTAEKRDNMWMESQSGPVPVPVVWM